ncbi:hypothetical protein [Phytoactinopolyspora limicola]|uniref:hypothetical protein n=1 Tax=Phytoactinopolyspora limicola TaxID=2715536 RepID=UPI00140A6F42|nr:hypothetical protein [Phytoactinopolyspora limicola]
MPEEFATTMKFDVTADDLMEITNLALETTGELVPVPVQDPVTGVWYLKWVEPDIEPHWFGRNAAHSITVPTTPDTQPDLGTVVDDLVAEPGRVVELFIVGAELQRLGNHFANADDPALHEPFHDAANRLFGTALSRLGAGF